MNYLALVQALHRECGFPGSAPTAVTGQSGRAADLVYWIAEAYNDIQREKDGRWKWLRGEWIVNTTIGIPYYLASSCTDVATASAITRFRAWDLTTREPPLIYLVSDGQSTEGEMTIADWPVFKAKWVKGTHDPGYPLEISQQHGDYLYIGPTPDDVYHMAGTYWMSNQTLAADGDIPEMPNNYHMAIVYRAMVKYAYNAIAADKLTRARAEGAPLFNALAENQSWSRSSIRLADSLA